MSDYEFTDAAREELDFECSDCGTEEMPDIKEAEHVEDGANDSALSLLVDYHLTVECVECGRETEANVWDKDVQEA